MDGPEHASAARRVVHRIRIPEVGRSSRPAGSHGPVAPWQSTPPRPAAGRHDAGQRVWLVEGGGHEDVDSSPAGTSHVLVVELGRHARFRPAYP